MDSATTFTRDQVAIFTLEPADNAPIGLVRVLEFNSGYVPYEGRTGCMKFRSLKDLDGLPAESFLQLVFRQHLPLQSTKTIRIEFNGIAVTVVPLEDGMSTEDKAYTYFLSPKDSPTWYCLKESPERYQRIDGKVSYLVTKVKEFVCKDCGVSFAHYRGMTTYRQCQACQKVEQEDVLISGGVEIKISGPRKVAAVPQVSSSEDETVESQEEQLARPRSRKGAKGEFVTA